MDRLHPQTQTLENRPARFPAPSIQPGARPLTLQREAPSVKPKAYGLSGRRLYPSSETVLPQTGHKRLCYHASLEPS